MRILASAALAAATFLAGPAPAQAPMPDKDSAEAEMSGPGQPAAPARRGGIVGADPWAILDIAEQHGEAQLFADDQGDPLIEAVADGRPYDVTFYDCTENRECRTVMLRAGFAAKGQSEAQMAAWNRGQRFGKAYLDADGNPIVEMNVNLTGGVTRANLEDTFERWQAVLAEFAGHVGY